MFESLSDRLSSAFRSLSGRAQLTEENIRDGLREVRLALLEADVNFKVVKEFVERVRERVLGQEVEKSLTPTQQLVKAVHDELVTLLGGETTELNLRGAQPGLQHRRVQVVYPKLVHGLAQQALLEGDGQCGKRRL